MYQKTILIGRIGEIKPGFTAKQKPVTQLSIVTTESFKNKKTEKWEEIAEWHYVATFDKCAEVISKNYEVGDVLQLEGKWRTHTWEDSSGKKRYTKQLIVKDFPTKLPRYFNRDAQNAPVSNMQSPQQSMSSAASSFETSMPSFDSFDDDIPF